MKDRLLDSEEDERNCRRWRGLAIKELEGLVGGGGSKWYKKYVNGLRDKFDKERTALRKKNEEKVRRVKFKKKRVEFKLPVSLSRYNSAQVFSSDKEIIPELLKGPVIVGDREIKLSRGERMVLTRGPKYVIRRILSKEVNLNDMMKSFVKERWDMMTRDEDEDNNENPVATTVREHLMQ